MIRRHEWFALILILVIEGYAGAGASSCDEEVQSSFVDAIRRGDFSAARGIAARLYRSDRCTEKELSSIYQREADGFLKRDDALTRIWEQVAQYEAAELDHHDCWSFGSGEFSPETWDGCCSRVGQKQIRQENGFGSVPSPIYDGGECYRGDVKLCCSFYFGSTSYLRLPALRELELHLSFPSEGSAPIRLEQDGFLRRFDVAGILWPTGYLLSLCISAPVECGIYDNLFNAVKSAAFYPITVELGTGVGAPAIALAQTMNRMSHVVAPRVIATDKAPSALALTIANSFAASHHHSVDVAILDHFDEAAVKQFKHQYAPDGGFSVVLGSSLQGLFDGTNKANHTLWKVLDVMLAESNPFAVAILAHSTGALQESSESQFERLQIISGNQFGMKTRYGDSSDFEISVFRRKQHLDSYLNDEL